MYLLCSTEGVDTTSERLHTRDSSVYLLMETIVSLLLSSSLLQVAHRGKKNGTFMRKEAALKNECRWDPRGAIIIVGPLVVVVVAVTMLSEAGIYSWRRRNIMAVRLEYFACFALVLGILNPAALFWFIRCREQLRVPLE